MPTGSPQRNTQAVALRLELCNVLCRCRCRENGTGTWRRALTQERLPPAAAAPSPTLKWVPKTLI